MLSHTLKFQFQDKDSKNERLQIFDQKLDFLKLIM